ncbi:phospho-sugar mutase [Desnuesiella massiliensis]|uniref:phospho-sugar mutase n=1 Tax=Desnuesiella massiliensis TaxID=1650662 RepID=UPI0006E3C449|nr:phospho-sugar mutase [Desnuesiella massiliensis]
MTYSEKLRHWLEAELIDEQTKQELRSLKDEKDIEDRFYRDLEFGTGGLRGIIGAGSNRMNIYTVGKVTQGFADFLNKNFTSPSIAIAYDSRNMSEEFAKAAALNLCANNIKVYLFESLRPTPMLSFAVRHLKCSAGIVITASHNPKQYNGYKVYGEDGGQVTDNKAKEILSNINEIQDFSDIKNITEEEAINRKLLCYIGEDVDKEYINRVKDLSIRKDLINEKAEELNIIYTPIHGSGNIPVRRVLKEQGYKNVFVIKEQEMPDGNFPTAPYPNPEEPEVFKIALKEAEKIKADIIFGTDPDCDRIGVVVKDSKGEYKVLTGNQTGMLLTHYILSSLEEMNKMPQNGTIIKTIVTTDSVRNIAKDFNIEVLDVLTGFKYIGEKIKEFEETKEKSYIFGFEESFGYLAGTFVRDKDAVIAASLICEMTLYYKSLGKSLNEALVDIYERYGYFKEELLSFELKGKEGQEKISKCIEYLRHSMKPSINGVNIIKKLDYKTSIEKDLINIEEKIIELPKSNVLKFVLEDNSWFVVRPSGTEPKMKIYLAVRGISLKDSENKISMFKNSVMELIEEAFNY